jgi:hypothetical protein
MLNMVGERSPSRVPIAKLIAAQAAIKQKDQAEAKPKIES